MEVIRTIVGCLTWAEVAQGLALGVVCSRLLTVSSEREWAQAVFAPRFQPRRDGLNSLGFWALYLAARCWLNLVNTYVPEPYLDEVFHIPQAQKYCEGRFWYWDDKITTPPGLYLLSVAYHKLRMLPACTAASLRSNNVLATVLTGLLAAQCRHLLEMRSAEREGSRVPRSVSAYASRTGVNVAAMPVIFFFSGLYYTDVFSALVVLVAYRNHLLRLGAGAPSLASDVRTVLLGIAALLMRQTNVFWVVVYMGGSEAVYVLGRNGKKDLHDPLLDQSDLADWVLCALSVATAALRSPGRVLRQVWPHITILALFAGFVAWNGGVVLGDKSNHVATLHLPQLLYIWPFFAFFSAPLLLRSAALLLRQPLPYLLRLAGLASRRRALVAAPHVLLAAFFSLLAVRYNTIVHPFTLADNRHYMFYVFRRTILRGPGVRLLLVAPYTLCRWLVWDQLTGPSTAPHPSASSTLIPTANTTTTTTGGSSGGSGGSGGGAAGPAGSKENERADTKPDNEHLPLPRQAAPPASALPPRTSTALLWLLATSLSLVTAPLVEPRYFILPWVFYRLLVPAWTPGGGREEGGEGEGGERGGTDVRLGWERAWFFVVNAATMYVFLRKGFVWRGEDGEVLDGGRVQRFMW
ncbi:hypothetical protein VTJ83DRAFT_4667 [Remersonia thermophila]|uniref:Dol-P-Glc:Glc(2)Man(9)GlcNAc(2)-PP-Dol alpha-1,2-glucosyltransferase n=1 Tax=Remersonia thermophila TaxID=72144 RepID=A0ABR4DBD2_9PEZI